MTKTDIRNSFEEDLMKKNVAEYFLSKTKEEMEQQYGIDVSNMIGFDQKNIHHCYDLWEHSIRTVESINDESLNQDDMLTLRISAFFHDIGKPHVAMMNPKTGQQVFYGHAHKSADIAKPILEKLGYSDEEIQRISFYIAHHDDFITYKTKVPPQMLTHEFVRLINPNTLAEKIIENMYDYTKMGFNEHQVRVIVYTLANNAIPTFTTKEGPLIIPVDMDEALNKIASNEYTPEFVPTLNDYHMLLRLCAADANAQSEVAERKLPDGRIVSDGTRQEKVDKINYIDTLIDDAYEIAYNSINNLSRLEISEEIKHKNI